MASITIRNLPDHVKEDLRIQGAQNGRSMEAEARAILESALADPHASENILQSWRRLSLEVGGLGDLELPPRDGPDARPTPFSEQWERDRADHAKRAGAKKEPAA